METLKNLAVKYDVFLIDDEEEEELVKLNEEVVHDMHFEKVGQAAN